MFGGKKWLKNITVFGSSERIMPVNADWFIKECTVFKYVL